MHDIRETFDQKVRSGIFGPIARHVFPDIREDRLAEGIAFAWRLYREQVGNINTALLVHHARLRAVDCTRQIAGGYCATDVLDPGNVATGAVELLHLGGQGVGLARELSSNPARNIVSAISLHGWLAGLHDRDRKLLELRATGHTLEEIAEVCGGTFGTVCKRLERLGLELAERAGITIKKDKKRGSVMHQQVEPLASAA